MRNSILTRLLGLLLPFLILTSPLFGLPVFFGGNHSDLSWKKLVSPRFELYYQDDNLDDATYTLKYLEYYLPALEEDLGIKVHNRIEVVLFSRSGVGGFANLVTDQIEISSSGRCTKGLILHELTHHVMYKHFDNVLGAVQSIFHLIPMPPWFLEGLAEYESDSNGPFNIFQYLTSMELHNTYPTFDRLNSDFYNSSTWMQTGYLVGRGMVDHITRRLIKEPLALLKLLAIFKDNTLSWRYFWSFDQTLEELTKFSPEQIYSQWKKQNSQMVRTWAKSKDRIVQKSKRIPLPSYNRLTYIQPVSKFGEYIYMDRSNDRGFYSLKFAKVVGDQWKVYDTVQLPFRPATTKVGIHHKRKHFMFMERLSGWYGEPQTRVWELDIETKEFKMLGEWPARITSLYYAGENIVLRYEEKSKQIIALFSRKLKKLKNIKTAGSPYHLILHDVTKFYGSVAYTLVDDNFNSSLSVYQRGKHRRLEKIPETYNASSIRFIDDENLLGLVYPNLIGNVFTYNLFKNRFKILTNMADSIHALEYDTHNNRLFFNLFTHPYWQPRMMSLNFETARRVPHRALMKGSKEKPKELILPIAKRLPKKLNKRYKFQDKMYREFAFARFKHIFSIPTLGNDDRGMTVGVFSVPLIDSLEKHLVEASLSYGLYSNRPSYGLTYTNSHFLPTIYLSAGDNAYYNGVLKADDGEGYKISYLRKPYGRIGLRIPLRPVSTTLFLSKEYAHFSRLLGPKTETGSLSLNTLSISYSRPVIFGGFGAGLSYRVTDGLFDSYYSYQRFAENLWFKVDLPWDSQIFRVSIEHAFNIGKKKMNAPETYSSFVGIRNNNVDGFNNRVIDLSIPGTVSAVSSKQGDQKLVSKLSYDFPVVSTLDKRISILYLDSLDGSAFVYLGNAWSKGALNLNDFKLISGFNLSLSMENKGVQFAPGLGFSLDMVKYQPSVYFSFSYAPLLDY